MSGRNWRKAKWKWWSGSRRRLRMLQSMRLLTFAALGAACSLRAADPAFFNVLDYGAKRDASAPSTAAFRTAIEAASKVGGGTVFVPAGQYTSGAIVLASNINFHIDAGATIRFLADRSLYPMVGSRFEGTETRAPEAMIGAHNAENIAITGRGTLVADNAEWLK